MDGEFSENTAQMPSEASTAKGDDSPPADVRTLCIGSCWICGVNIFCIWHPSVRQWDLPVAFRALSWEPTDGILLKLQSFKPVLFFVLSESSKYVFSASLLELFVKGLKWCCIFTKNFTCSAEGGGWCSLMPASLFHLPSLPAVHALLLWNTRHLCHSHSSCHNVWQW